MIKSIIALVALSTLCIPQVEASTAPFSEVDLLEYHESKGGRVYVDSDLCTETGAMGLQQGVTVHICIDAHNGNKAEVLDTIRHEMWHVVQMCNKAPITESEVLAIGEAYAKGWTGKGYDKDVWHHEAEAHFAASSFTPQEIKNALDRFCFS